MDLRRTLAFLLPFALALTVTAALLEFFLLRLLLRMGALIPAGETIDRIFGLLMNGGLVSLNVALMAGAVSIAAVALLLRNNILGRSLAALLMALLAMGILLAVLAEPFVPFLYQALGMATLVPLILLHPRKRSWDFLGSCAIVAAIGTTYYYQAALNSSALGLGLPYASSIFSGGEVMAIAAPILLLPDRRWRAWVVPLALLPAIAFLMVSSNTFVPLIATWTVYFTLLLPAPIYAVALGAYIYSVTDLLSTRSQRWMGVGLMLVTLGGRMFQNTYLALLSLLGALLIILPISALVAEASEVPASSSSALTDSSPPDRGEPGKPFPMARKEG
ncbi:MAG: hypothetical protein ACE5HJ_08985 [Thermoplasmata archaeon]